MVCSAAETMLLSGRVADDDALLGGVGDVDVVEPRTGAAHDAQVGGRVEEALVDQGLAADDDAVVRGDDLEELLVTQAVLDVDLAGRRSLARISSSMSSATSTLDSARSSNPASIAWRVTAPAAPRLPAVSRLTQGRGGVPQRAADAGAGRPAEERRGGHRPPRRSDSAYRARGETQASPPGQRE